MWRQGEYAVGHAASRLFARAGPVERWMGATIRAIRREMEIRRAARWLYKADATILKDIGIARADIERVVRHGRDGRRG
jgi:uncharacterized protein YjiS (DUF1127 family)